MVEADLIQTYCLLQKKVTTYTAVKCVLHDVIITITKSFVLVSAKIKSQIADALLNVANDNEYKKRFAKYRVEGFERTNSAMYECIREVLHLTKNQTLYPTYY